MSKNGFIKMTVLVAVCLLARGGVVLKAADGNNNDSGSACKGLPSHAALRAALVSARMQSNGGFNLDMWGTIVNRDGIVCEVAFTGADRGSQWPGSRAISAQKANTANAFSLPKLALVDGEPVQRGAAGRKFVWAAGEQSGGYEGCVWRRRVGLWAVG